MTEKEKLKEKDFEAFKSQIYQTYGEDPMNFFKFFYENNDIFNTIQEEDMQQLKEKHVEYEIKTTSALYGTLLTVLFVDQIILRFAFPRFNKPFRLNAKTVSLNLLKYVGIPLVGWRVCEKTCLLDVDKTFNDQRQKYNFNYEDFNRSMKIVERAFKVGRMEELMQVRAKFDWTGVPE